MERSDRVGVVEATFNWDDVGSWEALSRTQVLDQLDNVSLGNVELVGARGSIAYQEGPGRIVLMGTEDLVVVQMEDTTMVIPRSRVSQLKEFLARVGSLEVDVPFISSTTARRGWARSVPAPAGTSPRMPHCTTTGRLMSSTKCRAHQSNSTGRL